MIESGEAIRQSAALIVRRGRVCLVTGRIQKRWILPKGTLEPGQSPAECAELEAWEEAGVRGQAMAEPIAEYASRKWGRPTIVTVFRVDADDVSARWPERSFRRRRWLTFMQAAAVVDVPEVQQLLRRLRNTHSPVLHD